MKVRALDQNGYPIDATSPRRCSTGRVPRMPRAGDVLELTTASGRTLQATVARSELDEPRGLFVLSCQYSERSITADDYAALANDPEWELKHLLE